MDSMKKKDMNQSLSYKLVFYVIVLNTLLAIVLTLVQINIEYRNQIDNINLQIKEIKDGYSDSLALGLWYLDDNQLETLTQGIYNLPNINYVELKKHNDQKHSSKGKRIFKNYVKDSFPLIYKADNNKEYFIGSLLLEVSTENTLKILRKTASILLITHIMEAIFISIMIIYINYTLVTKHLRTMINFFESEDKQDSNTFLVLDRKTNRTNKNDELQKVVESINKYITDNRALSLDLKSSKELLEERVEERTKELKESLEHLNSAQSKLIESAKLSSLGDVISGIAHEINTPLGIVLTSITYLEETLKNSAVINWQEFKENSLDIINLINKNIKRINNLVNDFKLLGVDYKDKEATNFNFSDYVNEVVNILKIRYSSKSISIIVTGEEDIIIRSHPGVFFQILSNLISNSVEHGFENKSGEIKIELKKVNKNIILTYLDNGKGVDKDESIKIFEPFYTTQRNKGHIGLGMNIVYNLVTQILSGTISYKKSSGLKLVIEFPAF